MDRYNRSVLCCMSRLPLNPTLFHFDWWFQERHFCNWSGFHPEGLFGAQISLWSSSRGSRYYAETWDGLQAWERKITTFVFGHKQYYSPFEASECEGKCSKHVSYCFWRTFYIAIMWVERHRIWIELQCHAFSYDEISVQGVLLPSFVSKRQGVEIDWRKLFFPCAKTWVLQCDLAPLWSESIRGLAYDELFHWIVLPFIWPLVVSH